MELEKLPVKHTYFPNLDGLRFIGSLLIIIFHIEGIKEIYGRPKVGIIARYVPIGNVDVSLFFVLSGFLITYLLLKEKKENNTINLKAYYARRTLRIWPLYFLILILGFFILPYFSNYFGATFSSNPSRQFWAFLVSLLFLPTYIFAGSTLPNSLSPTWSVRVEELFYLCLPLFLVKTKKYLLLFISIILILSLIRNAFFLANDIYDFESSHEMIYLCARAVLTQYRLSCMAIGGIGAYLVAFEKKKILNFLYRKDIQWMVYIITMILLIFKVGIRSSQNTTFPSIFNEFYSILFVIIIINLATNPKSVIKLDYKWMNYLGKVSYGLYIYNPIMRIFSMQLTEHLFNREISGWQMNVPLYFFTISFTIITSIVSYELFEKKFLSLKKRFI